MELLQGEEIRVKLVEYYVIVECQTRKTLCGIYLAWLLFRL